MGCCLRYPTPGCAVLVLKPSPLLPVLSAGSDIDRLEVVALLATLNITIRKCATAAWVYTAADVPFYSLAYQRIDK